MRHLDNQRHQYAYIKETVAFVVTQTRYQRLIWCFLRFIDYMYCVAGIVCGYSSDHRPVGYMYMALAHPVDSLRLF